MTCENCGGGGFTTRDKYGIKTICEPCRGTGTIPLLNPAPDWIKKTRKTIAQARIDGHRLPKNLQEYALDEPL